MQTVVGLYRTIAEANQVRQALLSEGYNGGDVTVIDQSESASNENSYNTGSTTGSGVSGLTGSNASVTGSGSSQYGSTSTATDTGVGAKIKNFFEDLTGHNEHTHSAYTEGVSRGGALVAVNVNDDEVDRAAEVLRSHGATDIDEGQTDRSDRAGYATGSTASGSVTGEQVIPIVEEQLVVGKRQVERGGVRVYSRVVSENVSENVQLHDERVVVDRHAVNRQATEADFANAGPIEVRATGEEAVVGKTGRVVEEVHVGKTASDRTETVQDSVRHTEVDVEPVQGYETTSEARTTGTKTTSKY